MNQDEIDQLVQKIADEVMKRLTNTQASELSESVNLLNKLQITIDSDLSKFPLEFQEILAKYRLNSLMKDKNQAADVVVVSYLSLQEMAYLAQLQQIDAISSQIIKNIFQKKSIFVLSTEYELKDIRAHTLYGVWQKYNQILKNLESYGLQFIKSPQELEEVLAKENIKQNRQTARGKK